MASTNLRQQTLRNISRIVIKVGSQLLTHTNGGIDKSFIRKLAAQIAVLIQNKIDVTLVSSGAVSTGVQNLQLPQRPKDIDELQAVAAVGQTGLMNAWHNAFAKHQLEVGQVLLTRGDFEQRNRYLNIRNCLHQLHAINAIPIINENDAVSVDEISLGDNDVLAAMVTNALCADALILLTVVDGLHDDQQQVIPLVKNITKVAKHIAGTKSALGTGGMATKLEAAKIVTTAGESAIIANGRTKDVLHQILAGKDVGTLFTPTQKKLPARQRWISNAVRPAGHITVDDGAARAITERKKSLLPSGITAVSGRFKKGDVITILNTEGQQIARGLTNYHDKDLTAIMGKRSNQLEKTLGKKTYDEVIHRDHLVLTPP